MKFILYVGNNNIKLKFGNFSIFLIMTHVDEMRKLKTKFRENTLIPTYITSFIHFYKLV